MREQEVRNLWEAYLEVCENQQLDEVSDELVGRAVNKRIAATGAANDAEMRDRTPENMRASVRAGEKEASMKTAAAKRRKRINNEETDLFDAILEHLVSEGYADTNESALVIMANMSEEWREDIMEISQKTATTVYGTRRSSEFDGDDGPDRIKNTNKLRDRIGKKFGDKAVKNADAHANSLTFGRTDSRTGERQERPQSRTQRPNKYRTRADGKMHGQDQNTLKAKLQKRRPSDSDN